MWSKCDLQYLKLTLSRPFKLWPLSDSSPTWRNTPNWPCPSSRAAIPFSTTTWTSTPASGRTGIRWSRQVEEALKVPSWPSRSQVDLQNHKLTFKITSWPSRSQVNLRGHKLTFKFSGWHSVTVIKERRFPNFRITFRQTSTRKISAPSWFRMWARSGRTSSSTSLWGRKDMSCLWVNKVS